MYWYAHTHAFLPFLLWQFLVLTPVNGIVTSYSNVSSVAVLLPPSTTDAPKWCECVIGGDTLAAVWYDRIFSFNGSTMVYTVIEGTQSTIGSQLVPTNVTYSVPEKILNLLHGFADSGGVTVVTLPKDSDEMITLTQANTYDWNIIELDKWTTYTSKGVIDSVCKEADPGKEATDVVNHGRFVWNYTSTLSYDENSPHNIALAGESNPLGIKALELYIASLIGAVHCSFADVGMGLGSVKVGVSILTATSIVYVPPQPVTTPSSPTSSTVAEATTTSAAPAKSPTPTQASATSTPTPTPSSTEAGRAGDAEQPTQSQSSTTTSNSAGAIVSAILGGIGISTSPVVTIGTQTFTASTLPGGGIVLAGQTLTPGGNVVVAEQTVSLLAGGSSLVVGGTTTEALPGFAGASSPVVVVGTQTYVVSVLSSGAGFVLGGQTLTTGGNVVLGGQTVSLASGGGAVVVGGSSTVGLKTTGTAPVQYTGSSGDGVARRLGAVRWDVLCVGILVYAAFV